MASSRNETQITWSSASSVTVSSATAVVSDAFSFNIEDWDAVVQINATVTSPQTGDVCDVSIAYSTGDVLGDSGDDFDTTEHAQFLGRLDTFASNTPGENPARFTVPINTAAKAFKVIVSCPQAASRNIVVRARVITHRPQ